MLRRRLMRSGDLAEESSYPDHFGSDLDTAVKRFQASNGLAPTGMVDKRTIAALNVPSEVRLAQLKTNLTRLTDLTKIVGKRYVLVNIPAAQVEAMENNAVVSRHSGVVGKPDRPTPMLRSTITDLAFNPMWTLPPTVIKEDLIPKGRDMQQSGAESVLVKFGIDAYEGGKKVDPEVDRLVERASDAAVVSAGAGKRQPARLPEDQLRKLEFGLYARQSEGVSFRA